MTSINYTSGFREIYMKFKFIQTDDPEYIKELMLRWEVLQKPKGLPPGSEVIPEEEDSLHLLALEGKNVIGCVLFHPETTTRGKMHQLAISDEYRGRGFMRQILNTLEKTLLEMGVREIHIQAVDDTVSFYTRMGYEIVDKPSEGREGSHRKMKKELSI